MNSKSISQNASFSFLAVFCKRLSRVQINAVSINKVDARRCVSI